MAMQVKKVEKDYSVLRATRLYPAPPSEWYHVEGQAEMIPYTSDELRDNARAAAQKKWNRRSEDDTRNYPSWLASFTFFGENEGLVRVVKNPNSRKQIVGKIWYTELLPDESFSAGCYEETKNRCIDQMAKSKAERAANKANQGRLYHVRNRAMPPSWEKEMSTQDPIEVTTNNGRPSTVSQLLHFVKEDRTGESVSKSLIRILSHRIVVHNKRPLQVLTRKEMKLFSAQRPLAMLVTSELKITKGMWASTTVSKIVRDWSKDDPLVKNPHETRDTARYISWLRLPEVMMNAAALDMYNFSFATKSDIVRFDKLLNRFRREDYCTPLNAKLKDREAVQSKEFVLIGLPTTHEVPIFTPFKNNAISYSLLRPYVDDSSRISKQGLYDWPPMANLEYEYFTRAKPIDIDKQLYEDGLISESQYCTGADAMDWAHMSYVLQGKDEQINYFNNLFSRTSIVEQMGLISPDPETSVLNTEAPANDAVYVDVKKTPTVESPNWTGNISDSIAYGSKVALNWVVKKITDV